MSAQWSVAVACLAEGSGLVLLQAPFYLGKGSWHLYSYLGHTKVRCIIDCQRRAKLTPSLRRDQIISDSTLIGPRKGIVGEKGRLFSLPCSPCPCTCCTSCPVGPL